MTPDRRHPLSRYTPARVALGRAGGSMPTSARLRLRTDHARARSAVDRPFDVDSLLAELDAVGLSCRSVASRAATRADYVRRPDLGRTLASDSMSDLSSRGVAPCDLAIVLCDGLSPGAVQRDGTELTLRIAERLPTWSLAPVVVVTNGRVAVGDHIGVALGAGAVVVLIGERPGMSVPESVGAYVTHAPRVGCTDAERNCVSNIHKEGLSVGDAADRVGRLLEGARALGASGVALSLDDPAVQIEPADD